MLEIVSLFFSEQRSCIEGVTEGHLSHLSHMLSVYAIMVSCVCTYTQFALHHNTHYLLTTHIQRLSLIHIVTTTNKKNPLIKHTHTHTCQSHTPHPCMPTCITHSYNIPQTCHRAYTYRHYPTDVICTKVTHVHSFAFTHAHIYMV